MGLIVNLEVEWEGEGMGKDGKGLYFKILLGYRECLGFGFIWERVMYFEVIF